jgi:hypothetical protein
VPAGPYTLLRFGGVDAAWPRRLTIVAAVAVATAVASGCGGASTYAGLTRDEAETRVETTLRAAEDEGRVARELAEELAGTPQEAMGSIGGADGLETAGARATRAGATLVKGAAPSNEAAWVGAYGLEGVGATLTLCVYVWDSGSAVDVRASC